MCFAFMHYYPRVAITTCVDASLRVRGYAVCATAKQLADIKSIALNAGKRLCFCFFFYIYKLRAFILWLVINHTHTIHDPSLCCYSQALLGSMRTRLGRPTTTHAPSQQALLQPLLTTTTRLPPPPPCKFASLRLLLSACLSRWPSRDTKYILSSLP